MQLALGRKWVLELSFSIAVQERVDEACASVRTCVQASPYAEGRWMRWERDRMLANMLTGWDRTI